MPKTIEINIKTKADTTEAEDLQEMLKNMKDVEVEVVADDTGIEEAKEDIEKLDDEKPVIDMVVDGNQINYWKKEAQNLDGSSVWIECNFDGTPLKNAEKQIRDINGKVIDVEVDVEGDKQLDAVDEKIDNTNGKVIDVPVETDGEEKVDAVNDKVDNLNGKPIVIPVTMEGESVVDALAEKIANLNGKGVNIPVSTDGGSSLDGIQNKLMGVVGGIGMADQATQMWNASTARQSQQFYLAANLGADAASKMQREIQNIVSQVPGDDTFMNQLMTTALAQNTKMTTDELRTMASVAADYMAGSKMMGKMTLESQQDIYKYLLDGNTAELERGSILSSQVDKLKDQATIQDRIKAINEALQAMGYAGISGYDTAANNLEEFQGRLEKARADWGDVFLPLEQGALKAALALDDQYGGAISMAITGTQALIPTIITGVSGFGEFHRGLEALKETKIGEWAGTVKNKITGIGSSIKGIDFSGKFSSLANSLRNVGSVASSTASKIGSGLFNALKTVAGATTKLIGDLGKLSLRLLKAGADALISAGKFVIQQGVLLAQRTATMLAAGAQAFLNLVMSMNPIMLVVMAIIALIAVLGYLYFNNEQVRAAIDGLGQAIMSVAGYIWSSLVNALQTLSDMFTMVSDSINNGLVYALEWVQGAWQNTVDWFVGGATSISDAVTGAFQWILDSIMGFVGFLTTYAMLIIQTFINMGIGIIGGITGAIAYLSTLPATIGAILQSVIVRVTSFVANLVSRFTTGAINSVNNFMNQIRSLPSKFLAELNRMLSYVNDWAATLPAKFWEAGVNAVKNFLNALGIHSPGFMAVNFGEELERMENSANDNNIADNVRNMSKNMVESFGEPKFKTSFVASSDNGIDSIIRSVLDRLNGQNTESLPNMTFNLYGDMDDDKRMEKFLKAVRRELNWNNKTAGRTIDG